MRSVICTFCSVSFVEAICVSGRETNDSSCIMKGGLYDRHALAVETDVN